MSSESLISTEYNKVDWYRFFFHNFNQLYRLISNADKTRIEQPGLLLNIFLGKMTTFANIAMHVRDAMTNFGGGAMSLWSSYTGGYKYNYNKGDNKDFF